MLFPTMAFKASSLKHTTFFIFADKGSSLPISAQLSGVIIKDVWFSSKVLPVMSIVTLSFVVFLIKRTPFSFKVKHIEVSIFLHEMNYPSFNVLNGVSEGTVLPVFTILKVFRELSAKLCFILLYMIQSLNSIMS